MTRCSRLHASAWRRVQESPSDAVRQAEQLVNFTKQVGMVGLDAQADTKRQLVQLSEAVCAALKQLDAEVRDLRDGVRVLTCSRDGLEDEMATLRQQLEQVPDLQCQRKTLKKQVSASEQEALQLREECCILHNRVSCLQTSFTEMRQHRDDLLFELSRTLTTRPLQSEGTGCQNNGQKEESADLKVLTPRRCQRISASGSCRAAKETEQHDWRCAWPLQNCGRTLLHPLVALGQHCAMMIVMHHGYVAHGAAHAASTMMHHGASVGTSAVASSAGTGAGMHMIRTSLLHHGMHQGAHQMSMSMAQRRCSDETDSSTHPGSDVQQKKEQARAARESKRAAKSLDSVTSVGRPIAGRHESAGRPIVEQRDTNVNVKRSIGNGFFLRLDDVYLSRR